MALFAIASQGYVRSRRPAPFAVATTSGLLAFLLASAQALAAAPSFPDTYAFRSGYPTREATVRLYDKLDYQRAVQAYLWATPLVNSTGFMKALVRAGVSPGEPSLPVFDQRLTPKQVIMTANAEVIYASVFDLSESGPVVVEVPAGLPGVFWDAWQRGIEDIGLGRSSDGGRFIVLPPGSRDAPKPTFIPVRSRAPVVFMAARGIIRPGKCPEPFVEQVSSIKLHPLGQENQAGKVIPNGSRPFDSDWPKDHHFFEWLAEGCMDRSSKRSTARGGSTISRGSIDCRDAMRAVARYFSQRRRALSPSRTGLLKQARKSHDPGSAIAGHADQLLEQSQLIEWVGNSAQWERRKSHESYSREKVWVRRLVRNFGNHMIIEGIWLRLLGSNQRPAD
jgi:hypothetical protein